MPEKTDNPTELWVWKFYLHEMGNVALNTLVNQSIDNHLITEENGMTLTFLGVILLVKMLLEMN